jgi:hypothetical protein
MSTEDDDIKVPPELAASCLLNDGAELIALSAAAAWETTRLHWEAMKAMQEGKPIPAIENPYAQVLLDLLAGRDILSGLPQSLEGK